jgi:hypothetical protein
MSMRQITPAQFAEIERRLEVMGEVEPPVKSAAVFDASGIPEGTTFDFSPSFFDDMARCIRGDGKPLDDSEFEQLLRYCGISEKPH